MDELLRHGPWLGALARHLVREDAEDAVQDVWASAVERPRDVERARPWLFRVLLNRVRSRVRAERRRRRWELESETWAEPSATPEEAAARAELYRLLATSVAELPEPYRHVIYLRYFEHREPSEIARLLGTPPGTIRWRLKEALAKLRARLDDQHEGNRAAWLGLLMSAVRERPTASPRRWPNVALATMGPVLVAGTAWLLSAAAGDRRGADTSNATPARWGGAAKSVRARGRNPPRFVVREPAQERPKSIFTKMEEARATQDWRGMKAMALFEQEQVDSDWAPRMEAHLRQRLSGETLAKLGLSGLELVVTTLECRMSACRLDLAWSTSFVGIPGPVGMFEPREPPTRYLNNEVGPLAGALMTLSKRQQDPDGRTREGLLLIYPDDRREPEAWARWLQDWTPRSKRVAQER